MTVAGTPVKVCGLGGAADARLAADVGARALGFILYPESPRAIDAEAAAAALAAVEQPVVAVGVFVDPEPALVERAIAIAGFDVVQLSGDEPPERVRAIAALGRPVLKAVRLRGPADLDRARVYQGLVHALLVEAHDPAGRFGGTGRTADWSLARAAAALGRPIVLAGGLTPANVRVAIADARPAAVDVCSGVEARPGAKNAAKLRAFLAAAALAPTSTPTEPAASSPIDAFGAAPRLHR